MTTSSLPVLDPTAAAIDVGSEQMHVSVAGGRPKVFGTTTGQLHELRDWLKTQGVRSVAMEVTGIYWLCPYEVLEQAGLQGTWKEEQLFALRQAYELWQFYQQKIAECDQAIAKVLQEISGPEDPAKPAPPATKRGGVNAPQIGGLHSLLWRLCGHKDL